jgi:phage-related protein
VGGPNQPSEQPHRARVLFCVVRDRIVVLHGFIKKTQKTPDEELSLARKRKKEFED